MTDTILKEKLFQEIVRVHNRVRRFDKRVKKGEGEKTFEGKAALEILTQANIEYFAYMKLLYNINVNWYNEYIKYEANNDEEYPI